MTNVVWIVLKQGNRFLLIQRSITDRYGGTWAFPGDKLDPEDHKPIDAAIRELKEETGIDGKKFGKLCNLDSEGYHTEVFFCHQWLGQPKPSCKNIIGVGWFTLSEMYAMGDALAPFLNQSLLYIAYATQHYSAHPNEYHRYIGDYDENGQSS